MKTFFILLLASLTAIGQGSLTVPGPITVTPTNGAAFIFRSTMPEVPDFGTTLNLHKGGGIDISTNVIHALGLNVTAGGRDITTAAAGGLWIESNYRGGAEMYFQCFDKTGASFRPWFMNWDITNLTSQFQSSFSSQNFTFNQGNTNYLQIGPDSPKPWARVTVPGTIYINQTGNTLSEIFFNTTNGTNDCEIGVTATAGPYFYRVNGSWTNIWLNGYNSIQLGGKTAGDAKIVGNGAQVEFQKADASGYVPMKSSTIILVGTTNQVVFGATNNITPGNTAAPSKWISVQVQGESTVYALPLYQ